MAPRDSSRPAAPLRVGLFVTCLANLVRPAVAMATVALLRDAGCRVEVPADQTCCGQPGYNAGAMAAAVPVAQALIATFESCDHVVVPSGSCAGMIVHHYPRLLADDAHWHARALALAAKTRELTQFLVDVLGYTPPTAPPADPVTYHDSCAGLRELGIRDQPRALLGAASVPLTEMADTAVCCGFGGTFCAKLPDIALAMADEKLDNAIAAGARTLVGGDLGCLLHLEAHARARGLALDCRHVADVLAAALPDASR